MNLAQIKQVNKEASFRFQGRLSYRLGCLVVLALLSGLLAACGQEDTRSVETGVLPALAPTAVPSPVAAVNALNKNFSTTTETASLIGSGSTFAAPVYANWITQFIKTSPSVKIDYQAIGSGNGRKALLGTTVAPVGSITPTVPTDFAGSDAPFSGNELANASGKGQIVHVPIALGGVVAVYNLPELGGTTLKLSGPTLARIYLGEIKTWNDPAILGDNADLASKLTNKPIVVVIRTKGNSSGTSEIFSRYLSVVSDAFRAIGPGGAPKWTLKTKAEGGTTLEGNSNEEVATAVKTTDGAIGYVDQGVADAPNFGLKYAAIRNKLGRFVVATPDSVSVAATGTSIPDDFRTFVVDAEGANTYPIVGFTWLITWRDLSNLPNPTPGKARALTSFIWWSLHEGQKSLPGGYAPLPAALVPRLERLFVADEGGRADTMFVFKNEPVVK